MMYKGNRHFIIDEQLRIGIIHNVLQGMGDKAKVVALSSHLGRAFTYQKLTSRFYWYMIVSDVAEYIKSCTKCQRHLAMPNNVKQELKSIPVPSNVMKQIGVDLCSILKVDEFEYVVVCINYFPKWSETKSTRGKSTSTVAQFLYGLICKHGRFPTQINDQGREFVNEVSGNLHETTGTRQQVTSTYHPQSNDLVKRQNQTIKNAQIKVLDENPDQWPYIWRMSYLHID